MIRFPAKAQRREGTRRVPMPSTLSMQPTLSMLTTLCPYGIHLSLRLCAFAGGLL